MKRVEVFVTVREDKEGIVISNHIFEIQMDVDKIIELLKLKSSDIKDLSVDIDIRI